MKTISDEEFHILQRDAARYRWLREALHQSNTFLLDFSTANEPYTAVRISYTVPGSFHQTCMGTLDDTVDMAIRVYELDRSSAPMEKE